MARVPGSAKPRIGSLFSGYGGLDQGVQAVLGGQVMWHCDSDPAATAVLAHHHPGVPNLGDITTVDWPQLAETAPIDVLTGGFPCQDVSSAGRRVGMMPDSRSGLWTHMARAIAVLQPELVVIENVRGLLSAPAHRDVEPGTEALGDRGDEPVLRALGALLGDLAELGYDASWCGLRAADVGAPHGRYRVFIVATAADTEGDGHGDAWTPGIRRFPAATLAGDQRETTSDSASDGRNQGRPESEGFLGGSDAAVRGAAVPDTDGAAGNQRRQPASRETQERWARADASRRGGAPAADTDSEGSQGAEPAAGSDLLARGVAADTEGGGREARDLEIGNATEQPELDGDLVPAWGSYAPAIDRWRHVSGRQPPNPTVRNRNGNNVLAPRFVEWLMGLEDGHVTDVPGLTRNEQLRLLGNGVVPQQATAATALLLDHASLHA